MCSRILYETGNNDYITGRGMDWNDSNLLTNLWIFPKGIKRTGDAGKTPLEWTSKYGSVCVGFYDVAIVDGINEKGLVANSLYLTESDYGDEDKRGKSTLSIGGWAQYFLDNYQSVEEAVKDMEEDPFTVIAPILPNGRAADAHLSISDAQGDSAIFEYVGGKLTIHHSKEYKVMTNSPLYDDQLAINKYWELVGGNRMMPGTINPADRYVRLNYYLNSSPKYEDQDMALASVISQMRAIGTPLGMSDPDHPNISATLWRSVYDHKNLRMYFETSLRPFIFSVDLSKVDLSEGAKIKRLLTAKGEVLAGEVSDKFIEAKPFTFLH